MEIRKGDFLLESASRPGAPLLSVSCFLFFLITGCAAPGEPIERKPPTPVAIDDLTAAQRGNDVTLTFTLPREAIDRRQLKQPPTIEVYRDFAPLPATTSSAPAAPPNPTLLLTIPPAMVDHFTSQDKVRLADSLTIEDLNLHSGADAVYIVRTFESPKKRSGDSNAAAVPIYPAADPITDLKAEIAPSGVTLSWTPPQKTVTGSAPPISNYRVYRAETESSAPSTTAAGAADISNLKVPFARIAEPQSTPYTDTQVDLGKTYIYTVRSIAHYEGANVESVDSNSVTVTPEDLFPPSAPQNLVVAYVPRVGETPAHLELSWAISPENDIAGYNVYRNDGQSNSGTRLNSELLLTPAFRDMNAVAGRRYSYTVTAVDRSGNESGASAAAIGSVPAESQ